MELKNIYTDVIQSIGMICNDIDNAIDEYNAEEYPMETQADFERLAENEVYYKLLTAIKAKLENLQ